jgi:hypothetical protein
VRPEYESKWENNSPDLGDGEHAGKNQRPAGQVDNPTPQRLEK